MTKRVLATVAALLIAAPAWGVGEWYVGGGLGVSAVEDTLSGDDLDLAIRLDEDDTGYKIFAGYQVLEILSIEGGYRDFGSVTARSGVNLGRSETDGFDLYGVFNLPLGPIDLFAKAGVIAWDAEYRVNDFSASDSGTDLAAGIGVGFSLFELGARAEYERFDVDRPENLDMFSVSVSYGF